MRLKDEKRGREYGAAGPGDSDHAAKLVLDLTPGPEGILPIRVMRPLDTCTTRHGMLQLLTAIRDAMAIETA